MDEIAKEIKATILCLTAHLQNPDRIGELVPWYSRAIVDLTDALSKVLLIRATEKER